MAPEQKRPAVGHIGRGDFYAEGIGEAGVFMPVAHVRRRYPIGTAETVEKARQPSFRVGNRRASSGPFCERDGASSVTVSNGNKFLSDFAQRLIPTDALPTGIAIAFRSRALERVVEPIGMIDELRRGFAFDAENPTVRMIRVTNKPSHFPRFYRRDGGTMRRAQGAIAAHRIGSWLVLIHNDAENITNADWRP